MDEFLPFDFSSIFDFERLPLENFPEGMRGEDENPFFSTDTTILLKDFDFDLGDLDLGFLENDENLKTKEEEEEDTTKDFAAPVPIENLTQEQHHSTTPPDESPLESGKGMRKMNSIEEEEDTTKYLAAQIPIENLTQEQHLPTAPTNGSPLDRVVKPNCNEVESGKGKRKMSSSEEEEEEREKSGKKMQKLGSSLNSFKPESTPNLMVNETTMKQQHYLNRQAQGTASSSDQNCVNKFSDIPQQQKQVHQASRMYQQRHLNGQMSTMPPPRLTIDQILQNQIHQALRMSHQQQNLSGQMSTIPLCGTTIDQNLHNKVHQASMTPNQHLSNQKPSFYYEEQHLRNQMNQIVSEDQKLRNQMDQILNHHENLSKLFIQLARRYDELMRQSQRMHRHGPESSSQEPPSL